MISFLKEGKILKNNNKNNKIKEPMLYIIVRPIITLLFKILFHPRIIGRNNIPMNGSVVLGGNHTSNLDCLLLISSTKRKIHFLAKDSLIKGKFGFIFKSMGIIPVNRKIHDGGALIAAKNILKQQKAIGIFPESTINRSNDLILPFKIGCVKMAHDTNSPIVPFVIKGKYSIFGKSVSIEFFKPYIPTDANLDDENNKFMNLIKKELRKEK